MSIAAKRAVTGLALCAALLTACTPTIPDSDGPHVDVLGSMMASESEINTLMNAKVRPKTALRTPMTNVNYEPVSRPECMVVIGNAMEWVYGDSGYREFRETQLADDADTVEVDQAVARFDNPTAAQAMVARTVDVWRRCGNDTLTYSYDGGKTRYARRMDAPTVLDGVDVTRDEPVDVTDRINHRAILSVDNLVVDLRISGHDVTDRQTVQLARIIAGRNAL
ncbi:MULTISPECIES: sensor domain-containing protein [unclassified Mycolicibacterium]|uniref:sensor domain-containing protein n=1 Tax=unclassified Mycolicibacterium TaxID=2636767 RepID=UPI0012DC0AEA|nr:MULTISPECIES: sensor domain-containing protein [unclassified Mycolicibacterium]MUL81575.1 sensor domain-containing protein [Mycolicibacterium sp. CBMA 329]MUL87341.1 sensor domain-containing protein [Mycolicibacterium sp. CBMA 331]MUM02628.1 sensor domain-containing protein [Mycolicibacterium sp. CBMA 334]MUM28471.1 sensor domain-containing protein [Mycolicibacterium sp. CBMA 295]MUM37638.1 sensor domain-containing protein [Mycolicibacterium sp. CBMA 247]